MGTSRAMGFPAWAMTISSPNSARVIIELLNFQGFEKFPQRS